MHKKHDFSLRVGLDYKKGRACHLRLDMQVDSWLKSKATTTACHDIARYYEKPDDLHQFISRAL